MKLFSKAGKADAKLSVNVLMVDWHKASISHSKTLLGVSLGIAIGQLIVTQLGMEMPTWTVIPIVLLAGYTLIRLLWFTFHPKAVEIAVKQNESPTEFMVNPHQILWVTPAGDIPIFRKAYRVEKDTEDGKVIYSCYGKTSISLSYTFKQLVPHYKIWSCHSLICQFSVDAGTYPDAYAMLESKCQGK